MKKLNFTLWTVCSMMILTIGCSKDADLSRNAISASRFFEQWNVKAERFKKDVGSDFVLVTSKGSKYSIPADAFVNGDGNPVVGEIDIELIETRTKQEIMFSGLSTESRGNLLESGGQFKITAKQAGQEVFLDKIIQVAFASAPNDVDTRMSLFVAAPAANDAGGGDGPITWNAVHGRIQFADSTYNFPWDNMQWCNIDRFLNIGTGTNLTVNIDISDLTHTANGATVQIVFSDYNSVVSLPYDAIANKFTNAGTYYADMLPEGANVVVLFLATSSNGDLVLGAQNTTIALDQQLTLKPKAVTAEEAAAIMSSF